MSGCVEKSVRSVQRYAFFACCVLSFLQFLPGDAEAARSWHEETPPIQTLVTNCSVYGQTYNEPGAAAYVGYYADPDAGDPQTNVLYQVHIVVKGMGLPCTGGQFASIEIALPPNTSIDTSSVPIQCYRNGQAYTSGCPQSLQSSALHSDTWFIPSPDAPYHVWELAQGRTWEFQIPVRSTSVLSNATLQGYVGLLYDIACNATTCWPTTGTINEWMNPNPKMQMSVFAAPVASLSIETGKTVMENAGSVSLTVTRSGSSAGTVTAAYSTVANGNATEGVDYSGVSGVLTWASGDLSAKTITIPIINDAVVEGNESFSVVLGNPTGGAILGNSTGRITIIDDDVAPTPGLISFAKSDYRIAESANLVTLKVNRKGGSSGEVRVNYATANGSATAGQDYRADSGVLIWYDGETFEYSIPITLYPDSLFEANENFTVSLSSPTGGATLAEGIPTATVTIIDDDAPSTLEMRVKESVGTLSLPVNNPTGSSMTSLSYQTHDETAMAGTDYTATSGTLTWVEGNSSIKYINIPILNNNEQQGDRTFTLSVTRNGTTATGRIVITDDDAAVSLSGLNQPYDGTQKSVTCATIPDGLPTTITYSDLGTGTGRTNVGSYGVYCQSTDPNYAGSTSGILKIYPPEQTIAFGNNPGPLNYFHNGTFVVSATGGPSLNPVVFSSKTPGICTTGGAATVSMLSAGVCTVAANQAGNSGYQAALEVTQDIVIYATVPPAPLLDRVVATDNSMTLYFTVSSSTGGTPLTGYTATCIPTQGGNPVSQQGNGSPITISGLGKGTRYDCSVKAANSVGASASSSSISKVAMRSGITPIIMLLMD